VGWDTEFPIDALKKLGWRKTRIEDQGRTVTICVKLAQECTQDRRFPRSHFSRQRNESYPVVNTVQKVCERFPVVLAQEDKAGVRGQIKGFFPEAMKVEVHQKTLPDAFTS
jgi:hypothetical protein